MQGLPSLGAVASYQQRGGPAAVQQDMQALNPQNPNAGQSLTGVPALDQLLVDSHIQQLRQAAQQDMAMKAQQPPTVAQQVESQVQDIAKSDVAQKMSAVGQQAQQQAQAQKQGIQQLAQNVQTQQPNSGISGLASGLKMAAGGIVAFDDGGDVDADMPSASAGSTSGPNPADMVDPRTGEITQRQPYTMSQLADDAAFWAKKLGISVKDAARAINEATKTYPASYAQAAQSGTAQHTDSQPQAQALAAAQPQTDPAAFAALDAAQSDTAQPAQSQPPIPAPARNLNAEETTVGGMMGGDSQDNWAGQVTATKREIAALEADFAKVPEPQAKAMIAEQLVRMRAQLAYLNNNPGQNTPIAVAQGAAGQQGTGVPAQAQTQPQGITALTRQSGAPAPRQYDMGQQVNPRDAAFIAAQQQAIQSGFEQDPDAIAAARQKTIHDVMGADPLIAERQALIAKAQAARPTDLQTFLMNVANSPRVSGRRATAADMIMQAGQGAQGVIGANQQYAAQDLGYNKDVMDTILGARAKEADTNNQAYGESVKAKSAALTGAANEAGRITGAAAKVQDAQIVAQAREDSKAQGDQKAIDALDLKQKVALEAALDKVFREEVDAMKAGTTAAGQIGNIDKMDEYQRNFRTNISARSAAVYKRFGVDNPEAGAPVATKTRLKFDAQGNPVS